MFHRWHLRRPETASAEAFDKDAAKPQNFDGMFVGQDWGLAAQVEGWAAEGERPRTPFGKKLPDFHSANLEPLDTPADGAVQILEPDKQSLSFSTLSRRVAIEDMQPGNRGQPAPRPMPTGRRPDRLRDAPSLRIFPPPLQHSLSQPLTSVPRQGPTVLMTQNNGVTLVSRGSRGTARLRYFHFDSADEPPSTTFDGGPSTLTSSPAGSSIYEDGEEGGGLHGPLCSSLLGVNRPWSPPILGSERSDPRSNVPQHSQQALACTRVFNDPLPRFPRMRQASPTYEYVQEGACVVRDGHRLSQCFSNAGRRSPVVGDVTPSLLTSAPPKTAKATAAKATAAKATAAKAVRASDEPLTLTLDVGDGGGGRNRERRSKHRMVPEQGSPSSVSDFGRVKDPDRPSAVFMSPVYDVF